MTEQEQNELAKLCGYSNERYVDKVIEEAKTIYPFLQDEIAILRKQQAIILQWIYNKFGEDIRLPEFI